MQWQRVAHRLGSSRLKVLMYQVCSCVAETALQLITPTRRAQRLGSGMLINRKLDKKNMF